MTLVVVKAWEPILITADLMALAAGCATRAEVLEERHARAVSLKAEGNALFSSHRLEEANEKYREAMELWPENIIYRLNRAAALLELGQAEKVSPVD